MFAPLADGFAVDRAYLRAAVAEYIRAADAARVTVPRETSALLIDLLCTTGAVRRRRSKTVYDSSKIPPTPRFIFQYFHTD